MNMLATLFLATIFVRSLALPPHTTVAQPFERMELMSRNPISVGGNTVAADMRQSYRHGLVVWKNGRRISLPAIWPRYREYLSLYLELGTVAPNGALYAMRAQGFSGAYSGTWYDVFRLTPPSWRQINTTGCSAGDGVAHVERVEPDGSLYLTYESPELINFDYADTGGYAPYAAYLRNGHCRILGRFNLRDVNAGFAVGFRGYLHSVLAPTNLNLAQQRFVAVRYYRGRVQEIGPGEAFAVSADGFAVGSDAPPIDMWYSESGTGIGYHEYSCCTPHAVLWDARLNMVRLAPQALRSVAYQIDRAHRVVGMLLGRDGRHYAFLWESGHLHLLDEVAHVPGWRFEAAYRFLSNGSIVGTATHHGIATVFVMSSNHFPWAALRSPSRGLPKIHNATNAASAAPASGPAA